MSTFICIEGVDASGKTSVSQALALHIEAYYYKSPGGPYAEARKIVDELIDPLAKYFFYRAAVQYDSAIIRDLLKTRSVVCDRYIFSTQLCHAAMDERICDLFEVTGLLMPDQVFILTAEEKVRKERLSQRGVATFLKRISRFNVRLKNYFKR